MITNDIDFITKFWDWFDSLNISDKNKFNYYSSDMSELYFYNKHYRKIKKIAEFEN